MKKVYVQLVMYVIATIIFILAFLPKKETMSAVDLRAAIAACHAQGAVIIEMDYDANDPTKVYSLRCSR